MTLTVYDGMFVREFSTEAACVAEMNRIKMANSDNPVFGGVACIPGKVPEEKL